jgi:hypothetical protein
MLAREMKKYPEEFFRQIDVGRILLCKNLRAKNFTTGQVLALAMYLPEFVMVIDVTVKDKFATIHHELFHFVDFLPDYSMDEPMWAKLNPAGFKYDSKLWAESLVDSKTKGFISQYSRASVAEDKAELFACLVMDAKKVRVRARNDAILTEKTSHLKQLVQEFCPKMDEEFWKALDK